MSLRLPAQVLCRSAKLPTGRGWRYEPKIDGFRADSRRGHDFADKLPEREGLPRGLQLDGEIYAPDTNGAFDSTGSAVGERA